MNESGCATTAAKRDKKFYFDKLKKVEKDCQAISDPDFGRVGYEVIERRHKMRSGRAKELARMLGIYPQSGPTQVERLIEMNMTGEIDLELMTNFELRTAHGVSSDAVSKARRHFGIVKSAGRRGGAPLSPHEAVPGSLDEILRAWR